MERDVENERALVESVIFIEGEPVGIDHISRVTGLSKEDVEKYAEETAAMYAAGPEAICIEKSASGYFFAPKESVSPYLREKYGKKNESRLSRAAMETLSIIAYSQPITRAEIEGIRGVAADTMIRFLAEKGLIREVGKKDAPGKPIQFGTTKEFLTYFRLNSIADLPKLDELERERFEPDA